MKNEAAPLSRLTIVLEEHQRQELVRRAAERAIETGSLAEVEAVLSKEIKHGLHARFARVPDTEKAGKEPMAAKDVPAARERVAAELGFVTYVEGLREAAHGGPRHGHTE